ncbi:MAG: serine/threonine-protein kinase [Myxococcota bacterium]
MAAPSYCPLCDLEREEDWCSIHQVPTLPPGTGRPAQITNGSLMVGRYRIDGLLSHGGMGTVLEATQVGINRRVVVKVLRGTRSDDRARVRRFYQEARLVSSLNHPHIVRIFEFGVDPKFRVPFIAMERIEGVTLQRLVDREGPLPERRASRLFSQIVRALSVAHGKGVLHRDLKPRNIMVNRLPEGDEHVTVLDFGLAKLLQDEQDVPPLTAPGRTVGTPGFMSPEQVLGRRLDARSDLYGVGCMLFAAVNGSPPFEGAAALSVMRKQVREPPPPLPRRLSDGAPPSRALTSLVFALLEKKPEERPSRAEDVRVQLDRIAAAQTSDNAETLPGAVLPRRPRTAASSSSGTTGSLQPSTPPVRRSVQIKIDDAPTATPASTFGAKDPLDDVTTLRLPDGFDRASAAADVESDWNPVPPGAMARTMMVVVACLALAAVGTWWIAS